MTLTLKSVCLTDKKLDLLRIAYHTPREIINQSADAVILRRRAKIHKIIT